MSSVGMFTAGRKELKVKNGEANSKFAQMRLQLGMQRIPGWENSIYYS